MTIDELVAGSRTAARPAPPRTLIVAVAAVTVLALAGLVLAIGGFGRGDTGADAGQGPYGISQDVPTSFGAIAIDGLGRRVGPSGRLDQMQAFVAMTNLTRHPIRYSPGQFRLLAGDDRKPISGLQATFRPGTLLADANFSGQLRYPVPRDRSKRWIEFRDLAGGKPILIDLSRRGATTPDSAFDKFVKP